ncbi:MAG: RagB/SusD family nutrient uptake outer membrane protein [Prevotellaceae bacterium]|jgi:hypothetical protein|nr:RagB/SusD family nutrient uptake outer membrane protein [Prevotellaceae bacterium]
MNSIKHFLNSIILSVLMLAAVSCNDWLQEPSPNLSKLEDYYTGGAAAQECVTACYAPLMWEYNSTYFPEWFIGDVVSDDALKGGQNIGDMAVVYDMENWKTNTDNQYLLDFYRAQYQGIGRCNLALTIIPDIEKDSMLLQTKNGVNLQQRLLGEAHFLRAYYYFRLVRLFGGAPKVDFVINSSEKWQQPRASANEIYQFILDDLTAAEQSLWQKSDYTAADTGRVTTGAAQAMLLKVNLYLKNYDQAKKWGDKLINSHQYALCADYADNFTLAGENGAESVFEIQYTADPTSDYGEGNGFTRGAFTQILTRSRSSKLGGGWGFNHPTQNLYNEYEAGDPRRDKTIFDPKDNMVNQAEEIYLGSPYLNRKTMWIEKDNSIPSLDHASRGPLNNRQIRFADALLMYAEACCEAGDLTNAKAALNQVRARAREGNAEILPDFPYATYSDNQTDLRRAIRHERRVELAMEGHRWFDLCRWGIAKQTMDAYKATETPEAQAEMATFIEGKHELFPIPSQEIALNPMTQNQGY